MTAPTLPRQAGARPLPMVGEAADRYIRRLQRGYRADVPSAVAALARLRRGAGRPAHVVQDLWGLVAADELPHVLAAATQEERRWFDADRAEEALHLAVTLWALHQQSHTEADTHVRGYGLGRAVRVLMTPGGAKGAKAADGAPAASSGPSAEPEIDEPLRRRFVRVGTATTLDVLAQRLREIVLLLRKGPVPLDYGQLADQLYRWQVPTQQADVRRAWGRDFHASAYDRPSAGRRPADEA